MNAKSTIRKILFVTVWLCIGGGMFTLLLAAISKRNKGLCKDYSIVIKGSLNNYFLDRNDVEQQLKKATKGSIKGQPLSSLNLYELENMLENNTWVSDAELYIDNQEVLHISVTEKEPVARIFNTAGNSFYIDKSGMKMPLSEKLSARVPVFTGFPTKKNFASVDSLLLKKVTVMANYIVNDSFWLAQVAQIDITPERTFEMIPVVGNHIVRMGEGDNVERQLHRLMVFYKQVLSKTGFDKYKVIDVRYAGQVVASRYAGNAKVDSIQLKKNVEKLLQQSRDAENDTVVRVLPVVQKTLIDDEAIITPMEEMKITTTNPEKHNNPNLVKSFSETKSVEKRISKPIEKKVDKPKPVKDDKPGSAEKKPKAVMPPKVTEDPNGGYQ